MVDKIATLKKLHDEFPRFQLETLLNIVNCIVESDEQSNGILMTTSKKHTEDKTSNNQQVHI